MAREVANRGNGPCHVSWMAMLIGFSHVVVLYLGYTGQSCALCWGSLYSVPGHQLNFRTAMSILSSSAERHCHSAVDSDDTLEDGLHLHASLL